MEKTVKLIEIITDGTDAPQRVEHCIDRDIELIYATFKINDINYVLNDIAFTKKEVIIMKKKHELLTEGVCVKVALIYE